MPDRLRRWVLALVMALAIGAMLASPAHAANCAIATAQGSTGPASWQSYCWIDFSTFNNTTASSAGGQNFSLTLGDGTVMSFNLTVSGTALNAVAAPSWSGASIGNTAFTGIAGKPVLYSTAAGTTTLTLSNIVLTPPSGAGGGTQYMFVAADGESSNQGESLAFQSNGGAWSLLDSAGPISGSTYPTASYSTSPNTATVTGVSGTVGAYVFGSQTPTSVTTTLVSGGLQGVMFAVRFATVRLTTQIVATRVAAADQFTNTITATTGGALLNGTSTSGTALSGFTPAAVVASAQVPLTLVQTMASGSTDTLPHYQSALSCTNATSGSSTPLPTGVITTSYALASVSFGDNILCTYTETPYPHFTLTKALGSSGRYFSGDQFTLNITQGGTVLGTTTTTGTGTTVTAASTPPTQVTAGTAAGLGEVAAGTTTLANYTAALACTNANSASATKLPTAPGTVTPAMGDVISCTLTNTAVSSSADVQVVKTASVLSDPVNGTGNPKAIPGAILLYTFTVSNAGKSAVTKNSVFIVDTVPSQISVGTANNATFTQGSTSSGLTWAAADIAFSNASTAPASFANCTYTPVAAYDPAVRYVCLNPQGTLAGSTGASPSFQLSIQAQLN